MIHPQLRKKLLQKMYPCQVCGNRKKRAKLMTIHHIKGRNRMGRPFNSDYDKLTNLTWCCRPCHVEIHKSHELFSVETPNIQQMYDDEANQ